VSGLRDRNGREIGIAARARRVWLEAAREQLEQNIQCTLVSRFCERSGREMASAVRARRAWPEKARERL
jgi:hypothetical protein